MIDYKLITIAATATATAAATTVSTTAAAAITTAAFTTRTAVTTAAAAGRTIFFRTGDIDREGAAVKLRAGQGFNGFLRLFGRGEGNEGKSA